MKTSKKKISTNSRVVKDLLTKYKDTFQALCELINNSIQADAKNIHLKIDYTGERLEKSPISEIQLIDDGHGVSYPEFEKSILEIGTNVKTTGQGIGRFGAFQIGDGMTIETIGYDDKKKQNTKTKFHLNANDLNDTKLSEIEFDIHYDYLEKKTKTSYHVTISNLHHNKQDKVHKRNKIAESFLEKNIKQSLFEHYPYEIFNNKVAFKFNDALIDKDDFVSGRPSVKKIAFVDKKGESFDTSFYFYKIKADLNKVKVFFQTDNSGLKSIAHEFSYSSDWYTDDLGTWFIYVESKMLDSDLFRNIDIETLGEQQVSAFKNFVKEIINDFFKAKNKRYEKFIKTLEKDKAYPKNNTDGFSSEVQEVLFKKVAYLIEDEHQLLKKDHKIRSFLYPLLNRAIGDGHIAKIFEEVLKLNPTNTEKFHNLLLNTELESVVHFASEVSEKLQFLDFFYELNYGDISKHIRERKVLHKIIENQLWVFGESYNGTPPLWSDTKIGNILDELHKEYFHYNPTIVDGNLIELDTSDLNDITDLFFLNEKITDSGDKEIMIVELKAPRCAISEKEFNQINKYAFAIEERSALPAEKMKYKLILISSKLTKFAQSQVKSRRAQYDVPFLYDKKTSKNIEVYVMEWSELIEANRRKLGYLSNHLKVREKSVKETFETEYAELVDTKINAQLRKVG